MLRWSKLGLADLGWLPFICNQSWECQFALVITYLEGAVTCWRSAALGWSKMVLQAGLGMTFPWLWKRAKIEVEKLVWGLSEISICIKLSIGKVIWLTPTEVGYNAPSREGGHCIIAWKSIDREGQITGGHNTINLLGMLNDSMENPYSLN